MYLGIKYTSFISSDPLFPIPVVLSEPAPPGLLADIQPVLPLRPLGLQAGATAAAPLPQVAAVCCAALPALPSG